MRVSITRLGPRPQARSRWVLCAWIAVASCSASTKTEMTDFDETGRRADGYKVSATIVGKDKAQLDRDPAVGRPRGYGGWCDAGQFSERAGMGFSGRVATHRLYG